MSKGSGPPAPDYTSAAQAQGQSSQALNAQQTYANRPNISTPWGDLSYTQSPGRDPATGAPVTQWGENVGLTPAENYSVQGQQDIAAGRTGIGENLLTGINNQINTPPGSVQLTQNMSGAGQGVEYNPGMLVPQAENAVWNQFQNLQEPLQQQQTQAENAQLLAQGLKPGDQAYDTATQNLRNTQNVADITAMDQAVGAGEQEASTLFGERNAAQAQGFGQDFSQLQYNNAQIPQNISNTAAELGLGQEQQGYDINLLNSLMSGEQVGMPSFPGTTSAGAAQPTQYLSAAENQGQAMLNMYNAQMGASNSTTQAVGGLVGDAALIAAFA